MTSTSLLSKSLSKRACTLCLGASLEGWFLALLVAALFAASMLSWKDVEAARPSYFDVSEVRSTNLQPFPKWTQVLQRYAREKSQTDAACERGACSVKRWYAKLDALRGKSRQEQVESINRFVNGVTYVLDSQGWGRNDYWATPFEFFGRGSGDCEDYAIAKYLSLKLLGFPLDDMRIVILQDLNLGGIIHAVLEVSVDGEDLILDNQAQQVRPKEKIYHYKPVYAINESAWWAFRR